jgi:hypothetical protein
MVRRSGRCRRAKGIYIYIYMRALPKTGILDSESPGSPRLRDARAALPPAPSSFFTVHPGDARRLELILSRYSSPSQPLLTSTITSPPYGGLKDYGHPAQIGYGQPFDEYLLDMRRIFRAIYRHTRPSCSMWVVADTLRQKTPGNDVWHMEMWSGPGFVDSLGLSWLVADRCCG